MSNQLRPLTTHQELPLRPLTSAKTDHMEDNPLNLSRMPHHALCHHVSLYKLSPLACEGQKGLRTSNCQSNHKINLTGVLQTYPCRSQHWPRPQPSCRWPASCASDAWQAPSPSTNHRGARCTNRAKRGGQIPEGYDGTNQNSLVHFANHYYSCYCNLRVNTLYC